MNDWLDGAATRRSAQRWQASEGPGWNNPRPSGLVSESQSEPYGAQLSSQPHPYQQEFVLEIEGRAVLALMSSDIEQARKLCSEDWFFEELSSYRSCGHPIWDGTAELCVRHANPREAAQLKAAYRMEQCRREYEGYVFAFLIPVDPALN
jgi:hypothetical protein